MAQDASGSPRSPQRGASSLQELKRDQAPIGYLRDRNVLDGARRSDQARDLRAPRRRSRAVTELASTLPVSRSAVSQHLKVLKSTGRVIDRQAGKQRIYHVDPDGLAALRAELEIFRTKTLAAYKTVAEQPTRRDHEHRSSAPSRSSPTTSAASSRASTPCFFLKKKKKKIFLLKTTFTDGLRARRLPERRATVAAEHPGAHRSALPQTAYSPRRRGGSAVAELRSCAGLPVVSGWARRLTGSPVINSARTKVRAMARGRSAANTVTARSRSRTIAQKSGDSSRQATDKTECCSSRHDSCCEHEHKEAGGEPYGPPAEMRCRKHADPRSVLDRRSPVLSSSGHRVSSSLR